MAFIMQTISLNNLQGMSPMPETPLKIAPLKEMHTLRLPCCDSCSIPY